MDDPLVWYASYGSNLHRDRFLCYLQGGRPPSARRHYEGARDPSPPRADHPLTIPYPLYFAGASRVWTGGVAFVDHTPTHDEVTLARAFLVTLGQLADVIAQESLLPVGSVELDRGEPDGAGHVRHGHGRYDTVLHCGEIDGVSCLTFTGPTPMATTEVTPPAAAYLAMLATGLRTTHSIDDRGIVEYLGRQPGVRGHWSAEELVAVVAGSHAEP